MTWPQTVVAAMATGVLTLLITWPLALTLARLGLIDEPNHRSMHRGVVPRGGGAGLVVSITLVTLICLTIGLDEGVWIVLASALGLAAVGFLDDRLNLPFTPRLAAQLAVAVAAVVIVRDPDLSTMTDRPVVPVAIVTVLWMLGCCNAVNFMDGVNGITGLHVVVFGTHLVVVARDDDVVRVPAALAIGAALGFLYWNAVRRKVFLGDGGAYFIGTYLALLVVLASIRTSEPLVAAAPFAIYAADTALALARRAARGENLTKGHREHVYQRLVLSGHGHLTVAALTACCSAACGAAAIAADRDAISPYVAAVLVAVVVGSYLTSPRWMPGRDDSGRRSRPQAVETTGR